MIKTACFQFRSKALSPRDNLDELERTLSGLEDKPELLVLPELFDVGYDLASLADARRTGALSGMYSRDGTGSRGGTTSLDGLCRIAAAYGTALCAGILETQGDDCFNSLYFISPEGGVLAKYRKLCLFPLSREEEFFRPGAEPVTVDWKGFRFGLSVCFDLRFPELYRYYRNSGCDAVIVVAAFPLPRVDHWNCLVRARAVENQYWVVSCNRVGTDASLQFGGNSSIVDPWGVVRSRAGYDEHALVTGILDREAVQSARVKIPCEPGRMYLDPVLKRQDGVMKW